MTSITQSPAPIGDYVIYKGKTQVIVDFNDNCTVFKILDPSTQVKLNVSSKNLSATPHEPMDTVEHQGKNYLVSVKGMIISLATGRVMKWDKSNGNRMMILAAVGSTD